MLWRQADRACTRFRKAVMGTQSKNITAEFQTELFNNIGLGFAATLGRFPEKMRLVATKMLSTFQAELHFLVSIGTDGAGIGRAMNLGNYAIDALIHDTKIKLGATKTP